MMVKLASEERPVGIGVAALRCVSIALRRLLEVAYLASVLGECRASTVKRTSRPGNQLHTLSSQSRLLRQLYQTAQGLELAIVKSSVTYVTKTFHDGHGISVDVMKLFEADQ